MTLIVIFIALILLYSMVSRRLERTNLTAPIVFTGAGMLALLVLPSLREQQGNLEVFMKVAEIGLVLLLFNDASRIDRQVLKSMRYLPVRLLSVGMLLTILLGALGALVVFRQLSVLEAGILAAIQRDALALRRPQSHRGAHAAGGDCSLGHATEFRDGVVYGMVRPARAGVHRAWAGLYRACDAPGGLVHHQTRRDGYSVYQHFCAWT